MVPMSSSLTSIWSAMIAGFSPLFNAYHVELLFSFKAPGTTRRRADGAEELLCVRIERGREGRPSEHEAHRGCPSPDRLACPPFVVLQQLHRATAPEPS